MCVSGPADNKKKRRSQTRTAYSSASVRTRRRAWAGRCTRGSMTLKMSTAKVPQTTACGTPAPFALPGRMSAFGDQSDKAPAQSVCPLLALSGHPSHLGECPLLGVKRTSLARSQMSAFDPKRTSALEFRRSSSRRTVDLACEVQPN